MLSFLSAGVVYVLISFGGYLLLGKNEYEKKAISGAIRKIKTKLRSKDKKNDK